MQNDNRSPSRHSNLPREFGPPIRRPTQPQEEFGDFVEDLHQHVWAHTTNNYGDYIQATKAEDRLFSRAMMHALRGLDAFRRAKEDSIRSIVSTAVHQSINTERDKNQEKMLKMKANFEAILTQEQKDVLAFRETLENHDWWYDYSDDRVVWKSGDTQHKELLKRAKDRGPAFQAMWVTVYLERFGKQANTSWTFDDHYRNKVR